MTLMNDSLAFLEASLQSVPFASLREHGLHEDASVLYEYRTKVLINLNYSQTFVHL